MTLNEWIICGGIFVAIWFLSSIFIQLIRLLILWIKYKFTKY